MQGKEKICTISGMRPQKLPGNLDSCKLLGKIDGEIRKSIKQGYTTFQTGMSMGVDIWAADMVLNLKLIYQEVRLVCYLPCESQTDSWTEAWRDKYFNTLAEADEVICLQPRYAAGCVQQRDHKMIDRSSRLIAVHDATAQIVRYASEQGINVVIINPLDCLTK